MFRLVVFIAVMIGLGIPDILSAQQPPYDVVPEAEPPYYRVRYDASALEGELDLPVNYTIWIPPAVETLRGVLVHQHGCGEGSCRSGLTGAYDLHWQSLATKHQCALLSPSYEQPQDADCQRWCDPRNGSGTRFQQALNDLGSASGHAELATVPWALWGHSGGGYWCGIMTLLHPQRVAASWLRSGVPTFIPREDRPSTKVIAMPNEPISVPIMINLGTEEGVTVTKGRFSGVWPAVERFFDPLRAQGNLIGIAIDPATSHQCGDQRYLAIPWFDDCLSFRLPRDSGGSLRDMPADSVWLAEKISTQAVPRSQFKGDSSAAIWLPSERVAHAWMSFVQGEQIDDDTPPPDPTNLTVEDGVLRWEATADLESGIAHFVIERNGKPIATVPDMPKNPFGRPIFQGLQYSDTPLQPLRTMTFVDPDSSKHPGAKYRVRTVNTAGSDSTSLP
ncbi:hypothetical protein [Neorhodopirellula pilleata]|uniref:Esterase PHB depolymerase n=1 Tax=Neorhodopirellula pilleata TaxID=2714738 RepID=A0A5C6A2R4_9BACT|nr:hypothetical protein [Neorhodopirellula pilleata]TWT94192.1 hypothetical protein Pla100_38020 [Neorhodopirellula pilleata]